MRCLFTQTLLLLLLPPPLPPPPLQRSYGCGTLNDVSPTADRLYHIARGLWGNDSPYGYYGDW